LFLVIGLEYCHRGIDGVVTNCFLAIYEDIWIAYAGLVGVILIFWDNSPILHQTYNKIEINWFNFVQEPEMNFLIKIASTSLAVFLIATLMPGVEVKSLPMAIMVSLILILINVYVKPILIFLTFPITIVTLGLFLLVLNASIILFTSYILKDGFKVDGFWIALLFSIVLSMVTSLIDSLTEKQ